MQLKTLSYRDSNWSIENLQLNEVSLLVGKNATGKSRTIAAIARLRDLIEQEKFLEQSTEWEISFINHNNKIIDYRFRTGNSGREIVYEEMIYDGEVVINRNKQKESKSATIKNILTKQEEEIYPPSDKLIIHTNRDIKKFPYLEEIATWAEQSYALKFGKLHPKMSINGADYASFKAIAELPAMYEELNAADRKNVVDKLNDLGYEVVLVELQYYAGLPMLMLEEKGIVRTVSHLQISQGMYRALALLIYFQYLRSKQQTATFFIDDLCEGLDYDRATKLGKFLFKTALENNIQLIATSNDSFLMEVVDLKYWNVLVREGTKVTGINAQSYPKIFEDFKFTGLSNFDFFSSSYLKSALK
ncbi:MAG: ATP-binding protein [Aureispira sp.]